MHLKAEDKKDKAIEEERRLMYVAITRAKDDLFISSPEYYRNGKPKVSRFLTMLYSPISSQGTGNVARRELRSTTKPKDNIFKCYSYLLKK